jgi:hypothetical protein
MTIIWNAEFRILPPQPAERSGVTDLEFAQQAAKAGNGIIDAATAQGVPQSCSARASSFGRFFLSFANCRFACRSLQLLASAVRCYRPGPIWPEICFRRKKEPDGRG